MALEGAQKLLDFSQKLDINLLDNVIKTMYHGSGPQVCQNFAFLLFYKDIKSELNFVIIFI